MDKASSWSQLGRLVSRRPALGACVMGILTAVVAFVVVEGIGPRGKYLAALLYAGGIGVFQGLLTYWWERRRQRTESPK